MLKLYGDCLKYFADFSSHLSNELSQKDKSLSTYITSSTDFILSQSKESFFKEKPKTPVLGNFFLIDYPIYKEGKKILEQLNFSYEEQSDLKNSVFKFYFYLFQFFSYIYTPKFNRGLFLIFKFKKSFALKTLELIHKKLKSYEGNNSIDILKFRAFSHIVRPFVLKRNINENISIDELYDEKFSKIYHNLFLEFYKNENITVEPFSWKVSNLIWHVGGIIQDLPEKLGNTEERNKQIEEIIRKVTEYTQKVIDIIKDYEFEEKYTFTIVEGNINFGELIELENEIYGSLNDLLVQGDVSKKIYEMYNPNQETSASNEDININDYILYIDDFILEVELNFKEEDFKLHKIIEKFQKKSLYILYLYYEFLKRNLSNVENTEFIGFSWSGTALMLTALKAMKEDKNVWFFKVFPYIRTHPIHEHNKESLKEAYLILGDETLKTGYTYSLYEYYLTSKLYNRIKPIDMKNIVLWNFKNYEKIDNIPSYKAIFNLNYEENSFYIEDSSNFAKFIKRRDESKENKSLKEFLVNLSSNKEYFKNIDNTILKTIKDDYIDFMWFLHNPSMAYSIAYKIAKDIKGDIEKTEKENKEKNKKEIYLYSPSPEGRLLNILVSIQLLFILDNTKIKFGGGKEKNEQIYNYLIDLSFNTGFTAFSRICAKVPKYIDKKKLGSVKSKFNKIFTVKEIINHIIQSTSV